MNEKKSDSIAENLAVVAWKSVALSAIISACIADIKSSLGGSKFSNSFVHCLQKPSVWLSSIGIVTMLSLKPKHIVDETINHDYDQPDCDSDKDNRNLSERETSFEQTKFTDRLKDSFQYNPITHR